MKRIILSLFLLGIYGLALATVVVQVDNPGVQLGQPFRLHITVNGTQTNSVPDLTPLQKDFSIVGTESNVSYSIINGQVNSSSEWTIMLIAKKGGVLQIPALQIGKEKSAPINIEVSAQAPKPNQPNTIQPGNSQPAAKQPQSQQQQQDVMLLTEVSNTNPYINQQVIYTVKLYNSRRLVDANYQPPQVEDAVFIPFGDERRYQVSQNGRIYAVEEQQYALFPQKSGALKIRPPIFNALVYDVMPSRISVQGEQITLKVKPIPADYKGRDWLPAKQVSLSESYDKSTVSLPEGSTLVRTLSLEAVAVPAQLLPKFDFGNSSQFSIYPEKPTENNSFRQQDLVGTKTVQVTYLLNNAGKITIPALTVPWFNTQTGKEEVSSLPEVKINVTPAQGKTPSSNDTSKQAQPTQPEPKEDEEIKPQFSSPSSPQTNLAWWLAGGFALAWLLTLLAWRWHRPGQQANLGQSKSQILKELQEACINNKPAQARDALIKWGRAHWPKANLLNLVDLENLIEEPKLKQEIKHLSQALYHNASSQEIWQGETLWRAISTFKNTETGKQNKSNPLPPINRL